MRNKKHQCTVCSKSFAHKGEDTLVGMLGIIPVQFCRVCFPKVMAQKEEIYLNDVQLKVVNGKGS